MIGVKDGEVVLIVSCGVWEWWCWVCGEGLTKDFLPTPIGAQDHGLIIEQGEADERELSSLPFFVFGDDPWDD